MGSEMCIRDRWGSAYGSSKPGGGSGEHCLVVVLFADGSVPPCPEGVGAFTGRSPSIRAGVQQNALEVVSHRRKDALRSEGVRCVIGRWELRNLDSRYGLRCLCQGFS